MFRYVWENPSLIGFTENICEACGRAIRTEQYSSNPIELVLNGGKIFPDYLQYCSAGRDYIILSKKTIDILTINNVCGIFKFEPLRLYDHSKWAEKDGQEANLYMYNNVHINGRIELDFKRMCLKKKRFCPICNQFEWNRQRFPPLIIDPVSWDGSDLCRVSSRPGEIICTDKFVKIIKRNKLKGFQFEEIEHT